MTRRRHAAEAEKADELALRILFAALERGPRARVEPADPHLPALVEAEFLERVPPERVKLRLAGKGAVGFVDGEVTLSLSAVDEGTSVSYVADVQVGGQIARLGQRMISGVTREMAGQFFAAFERWKPEAPEEKVAAPPARSFFQLVWRTLLRLLGLRRD